nr:MetaGeneMark_Unknown Function [uncultured bacterium]
MKEIDPLNFLKAVYMNADLPLSVRMRAAIELMPFMHPKLAVTAVVNEQNFAELLDQRLRRMAQVKIIEGTKPEIEVKPPMPRIADRRYRRM